MFEVMKSPDAAARFERAFDRGSPEAKAYALYGLRAVAPDRLKKHARKFALSGMIVRVECGCIVKLDLLRV